MGLGLLAEGKWISEREQEDAQGKFIRPSTTFRNRITADGSSGFKAEAGRYSPVYLLGLSLGAKNRNYAAFEGTRRRDRSVSIRASTIYATKPY